MARQMAYPKYYPTGPFTSDRAACWDFLLLNQATAKEACVLFMAYSIDRLEHVYMAGKGKGKNIQGGTEKAAWTGFANIDLSEKDKDAIRGGILDGDAVLDIITDMLATGHKIALSYDPERDTVTCAATGAYKRSKNAGLTVTSFGRDVTSALMVTAYKHEVVAKGDWSAFVRQSRPVDDLG